MVQDPSESTILVVDDEEIVLKSIKNYLVLETDYNILAFTSPTEALKAIENTPIDLVISDYLMPEMNGIEFLLKVKDLHPSATRIILTAYADKENAIRAINELGLFQYIEKPWDNDELKIVIRNGLERRILMKQLEETIKEFEGSQSQLKSIHNRILKTFV
jgi:response regulator RpfG family c-di-GMP phosphodiesterase